MRNININAENSAKRLWQKGGAEAARKEIDRINKMIVVSSYHLMKKQILERMLRNVG